MACAVAVVDVSTEASIPSTSSPESCNKIEETESKAHDLTLLLQKSIAASQWLSEASANTYYIARVSARCSTAEGGSAGPFFKRKGSAPIG